MGDEFVARTRRMRLKEKLLNASVPVTFFEMVPPALGKPDVSESAIEEAKKVRHLVDAFNLPEIRDEDRGAERTHRFIERVEPRSFGSQLVRELHTGVVVNRVVVHEPHQNRWLRETQDTFGIDSVVLVGGESSKVKYPGPTVLEAARQARSAGLETCLGGITIPSRAHEADRIRTKNDAGLEFFTTQVLFDSNDIVGLVQRLNGLEARIFLSFAPVSHPRDVEILRWLGVDIPPDLDRFLLGDESRENNSRSCLERSLDLSQRILMDVFDNLPPDPPAIGLNVEHINRRNFSAAVEMLERLGNLHSHLVASRSRTSLA
jgi:5,10-methylenetetrahydrofolate reductase